MTFHQTQKKIPTFFTMAYKILSDLPLSTSPSSSHTPLPLMLLVTLAFCQVVEYLKIFPVAVPFFFLQCKIFILHAFAKMSSHRGFPYNLPF